MLSKLSDKFHIILGSKSPRRKELLKEIVPKFSVKIKETEESYPSHLNGEEIAIYLSQLKSNPFEINTNELIITSDTIVVLNDRVLGKPASKEEAVNMLATLSGKTHQVITGVTIRTKEKSFSFYETTEVEFHHLTEEEIEYYVSKYKPYDKAGSYGIQEWIGHVGVKKITGDFYNVMGLPIHQLYRKLQQFI